MVRRENLSWIVGVTLLVGAAEPAWPVTVPLGSTVTLPGTTLANRPELAGPSIIDNGINGITTGSQSLMQTSGVIRETGGAALDFTYQIINPATSQAFTWSMTITGLPAGGSFDADVRLDTPGVDLPITATAGLDGSLTFTSTVALAPGQETRTLFIRELGIHDVRQIFVGNTQATFGDGTVLRDPIQGWGPIPEPASIATLALAAAGLALRIRRIRQG